jgi:DNA-binding NtrC family response regulator
MGNTETRKSTIVIFSESQTERDLLRMHMAITDATFLFFEKETICFDNLDSIRPDVIVLRTDYRNVVWRFIFAVHALKFRVDILIVSEVVEFRDFLSEGHVNGNCTLSVKQLSDELNTALHQMLAQRRKPQDNGDLSLFIGDSGPIKAIRSVIPNLKRTHDPILITGEPGTGKELMARIVGKPSNSNGVFVKLDCVGLFQDDIYGKTTFNSAHLGDLIKKNNGTGNQESMVTILIDCIDKASTLAQSEILMLIDQERQASRKKGSRSMLQSRFIVTSSRDLEHLTRKGQFRQDLFYRLNVIPVEIPPLRDRREDIPLLADYFMLQSRCQLQKSCMIPSEELKQRLFLHNWPGNVDELQRMIHRIAMAGDESIVHSNGFLPKPVNLSHEYLMQACECTAIPDVYEIKNALKNLKHLPLKAICDKFIAQTEKKLMQKALESTNWNRKKAAALLNISYKSMLNKMKMYEIV